MNEIKWQRCPRCGSARTKKYDSLGITLIGIGVFLTSIPLVIIIIGFFGMIYSAALTVAGIQNRGKNICKDCKYKWKIENEK